MFDRDLNKWTGRIYIQIDWMVMILTNREEGEETKEFGPIIKRKKVEEEKI